MPRGSYPGTSAQEDHHTAAASRSTVVGELTGELRVDREGQMVGLDLTTHGHQDYIL